MQPQLLTTNNRLKGTILVVDDDEGVRKVMARWTEDLGHQVTIAADADEAMEAMRRGVVDVALCDVRMPGRDGVWLVDQIRRNYPYTSIVLATGLTEMDPMITLRSGVVGYIVKPFSRDDLDDMIQRGLQACSERTATRPERKALTGGQTPQASPQRPLEAAPRMMAANVIDGVILARY